MAIHDRLGEILRNTRERLWPRRRPRGPDWHRAGVGGRWDALGEHQFNFLTAQGLAPEHRLLDVGCGSLRGGVHFIRYLDPGNYVGIDKEAGLIEAGRRVELPRAGLEERGARFHTTDRFDLSWLPPDARFDFAIAQSVFTHLRPALIQLCVAQVLDRLAPDGVFYASFFQSTDGRVVLGPGHGWRGDELQHPRYPLDVMQGLAEDAGARVDSIGPWGHPRDSRMLALRRP